MVGLTTIFPTFTETIRTDGWADNSFTLRVNEKGLEYINTHKQPMGDGGLIVKFFSKNKVIAATKSS